MPNLSKPKVKTFEVGYKGYYHEYSEWYTSFIQAKDEQQALRKFAKEHRIKLLALIVVSATRQKNVGEKNSIFIFLSYIFLAGVSLWPKRRSKLKLLKGEDFENWRWEDGDWFMAFRYIKEATIKPCPHCHGIGVVPIAAEN